mmetsp:Transcript_10518/g.22435  ORF Transcript_10518/g.22435 Transcript_10518/m.22435 type:complete len:117 (-) Transcript_10518:2859-3209(-)
MNEEPRPWVHLVKREQLPTMFCDLKYRVANELRFFTRNEIVEVHSSPSDFEAIVSFLDQITNSIACLIVHIKESMSIGTSTATPCPCLNAVKIVEEANYKRGMKHESWAAKLTFQS